VGAQALGASLVARASAPSCGNCSPHLACPAPPALACPSCVCAGAGGQVVEPSCAGLVAAYAVAACTVGLAVGAVAGAPCSRQSPSAAVMAGSFHAIRYRVGGVALWHERLVLGVSAGFAYVVTPDFDDYDEPIVVGPDVRAVLPLAGQGDAPPALVGAAVHRFRRLPSAAELWAAVGRSVAAGNPMPPDPLPLALSAANAAGAPPGPFLLADPAAAAAAPPAPPLALPPAAGPAAPVPPGAVPGVAALAAALGPVPPGPAAAPPLAHVPGAAAGGPAAVAPLPAAAGDFRVLPMAINMRGERERRFGETVNGLSETEVQGWPVQGPRTLLWCLSFMSTMAGTPTAWHQRWLTSMALADDDEHAKLHETLCRVLDLAVVYDQLQVAAMASFEIDARQLQLLEERVYESRSLPQTAAASKANSGARSGATAAASSIPETSYFLGAGVSKANLRISPRLLEYIADQMRAEAALAELLASAPGYSGESRVRPCDKELVSWPKHVAPVPTADLVSDADRSTLSGWRQQMLRDPAETAALRMNSGIGSPYVDPRLRFRPREYADFLLRLDQAGVLEWEVAERQAAYSTGFFFVEKSNGVNLRLVFDTRVANMSFSAPPSTRLPTPSAWSALEASNDFYVVINGVKIPTKAFLQPFVSVMPMGWSWALHFCQSALTAAIRDAGIDDDAMLVDGAAPRPLRNDTDVIAAGYVGNFATVSLDPEVATASCQAIRDVLVARGLPVDEFAPAAPRVIFTGLDILGDVGVIRCKVGRLCRLRQALLGLLRRGYASPLALSAVVGHCTWGMITNRPMLSIFHAVYRFMGQDSRRALPLWPSVVAELRAAASLIPLWWADVRAEWAAATFCSDASPYGIGVCRKTVEQDVAAAAGRLSERWRYRFSDAVRARAHALGVDPNVVLEAAVSKNCLKDCEQCPRTKTPPKPERLGQAALSVVESAAVSDTTMVNDWGAVKKFEEWSRQTFQTITTAAEVAVILVTYFVNLFLVSFDDATGQVVLASVKHYLRPPMAGTALSTGAARALTGWRKLAPPQMRPSLPRAAMASMVGVLGSWKLFGMAVFIRLMIDTYPTTNAAYRLSAGGVLRPRPDATLGGGRLALIVYGACFDRPGKTEDRHGGAADDCLPRRRTREEVTDPSLARHTKRARVLQQIATLDQILIGRGRGVDSLMDDLMLQTTTTGVFSLRRPLAATPTPPAVRYLPALVIGGDGGAARALQRLGFGVLHLSVRRQQSR
ncbi:unnamed protein product, partial [Prorocentrum cordatum]